MFAVVAVGEKEGVAPDGSPVTLKATEAVNPGTRARFTLNVVLLPATIDRDAGVVVIEKLGTLITKVTETFRVRPPPVPVIVSRKVPEGTPALVEIVRTVLFPVVDGFEKDGVAPAGSPLTPKAIAAPKPGLRDRFTVNDVLFPCTIVAVVGEATMVKSATPTISVTGTVRVSPPPIPVMVRG